jgi:hypothetical protein
MNFGQKRILRTETLESYSTRSHQSGPKKLPKYDYQYAKFLADVVAGTLYSDGVRRRRPVGSPWAKDACCLIPMIRNIQDILIILRYYRIF